MDEKKRLKIFPNSPDRVKIGDYEISLNPEEERKSNVINLSPFLKEPGPNQESGITISQALKVLSTYSETTPKRKLQLIKHILLAFNRQYYIEIVKITNKAEKLKKEYEVLTSCRETLEIINKFKKILLLPLKSVQEHEELTDQYAIIKQHGRILKEWERASKSFTHAKKKWGDILFIAYSELQKLRLNHPESLEIASLLNYILNAKTEIPGNPQIFQEYPSSMAISYLRQIQRNNKLMPRLNISSEPLDVQQKPANETSKNDPDVPNSTE